MRKPFRRTASYLVQQERGFPKDSMVRASSWKARERKKQKVLLRAGPPILRAFWQAQTKRWLDTTSGSNVSP
jgi:hypothetical protein